MVAEKKRLDKKFVPTLIAIVVLALLAVLILPDIMKKNTLTVNPEEDVFTFDVNNVNYFSIIDSVNSSYSVELVKEDSEHWTVNGIDAYVPDVVKIFTILKKVKVKKVINNYSNLRDFGLSPAVKSVKVGFDIESKPYLNFIVGDYAPASRDRYMKFRDDDNIYLVDSYLYSSLTVTPKLLENKDVFKLDKTKIVKLVIENKDEKFVLEKEKDKWFVTLPDMLKLSADQNNVKLILANSFGNSAKALIYDADDLKKYNLDKPMITVSAEDIDGNKSLVKVSSLIPSTKMHYITNDATGKVYIIDKNKVSPLDFNELEIRAKDLVAPSLSDIESITIKIGEKKYLFEKNNKKLWTSTKLKQESIVSHQFIEDLSNSLIDITSNLKIDDTKEDLGFDNPKLTIDVESTDGAKYKVLVGKKNKDDLYFVKLGDDPYLYLIDEKKFNFISKLGQVKKEKAKKYVPVGM